MGMPLRSVSVVRLEPSDAPQPVAPAEALASHGTYFDRVRICWDSSENASIYKIFRNTSKGVNGSKELPSGSASCPLDDFTAVPGQQYYYWVKACNGAGCSDFSAPITGWRNDAQILQYLPLIIMQ